jgi:hypothetical protein
VRQRVKYGQQGIAADIQGLETALFYCFPKLA